MAFRTLLLSENASVPLDGRVWKEAKTLRDAGYGVSIVSPRGDDVDRAPFERIDEIDIHRYEPSFASSTLGYAREYCVALARSRALVRKVRRDGAVDVVHAANPPDLLLLAALPKR